MSISFLKRLCGVFALAGVLWMPAPDANAQALKITSEIQAGLDRVSAYLNDMKTLQTKFLQISSTGETAEGTIYLERPKRLRIEYQPPTPVLILANGSYLSYVDTELKQVQHLALEDTPVAFLLRDTFDFTADDVVVTGFERAANAIRISMVQKRDPLAGEITLVFNDEPTVLRKWTIVDAQGIVTNVTLVDPKFGFPISGVDFEAPTYLPD